MKRYKYLLLGGVLLFTLLFAAKEEDHLIDVADVIWKVPTSRKVVALTFDDGPDGRITPEILEILREKEIKATFFVVGEQVEKFPELISREVAEGHEIGNHSYSHPALVNLPGNRITEELVKTEQEILKAAPKPILFRPPGGLTNENVLKIARDNEYSVILWSIDPVDWRVPIAGDIVEVVVKELKPGSIILLHDASFASSTPEALWFIIDSLKARGYEFVTVTELLQYYEP